MCGCHGSVGVGVLVVGVGGGEVRRSVSGVVVGVPRGRRWAVPCRVTLHRGENDVKCSLIYANTSFGVGASLVV